ncbi:UDP-N-acetyl-D-galactosamine dehydrogenase [Breoghania corrubedonensis]|uniref:UDP-N-acetyl-D-galactosamine dehydrogenase n=1 Tax=Breoghania corrubedonensis TaxID=665038 RepID=A0A2T5VB89_9HYPH|nr:nucleotide sugar dehydrogenase [Breoghania corrubedonensis]PTW61016.1 UDP-N-acetyl-D-galactosamine dehydrogenase [Breoghania corrubedonensis]
MKSDPRAWRLSVIGLGYVGLPVAAAFAKAGFSVTGFDIDQSRIEELRSGRDRTGSIDCKTLATPNLHLSADPESLADVDIHIVAVPTPIDGAKQPDLRPLVAAARTIAQHMKRGALLVFESTVYPGATEEVIVPVLEAGSGFVFGKDFEVGYSPERINPGDPAREFSTIAKVVSGSTPEVAARLAALYGSVVTAPIHIAPSIRVAEAAKVIENTQRDLNIALMNELSVVFHTLDIDTRDVLEAAGTKWNFLNFQPGLVGGHCIGVDPYYLTHKALAIGHTPQVVLAGRGINEDMARFVATSVVQEAAARGRCGPLTVTVLGVTYKANVPDTRNSKVVNLVRELEKFSVHVQVIDPLADPAQTHAEYGLKLLPMDTVKPADAVILAVPHDAFSGRAPDWALVASFLKDGAGVVADVPAILPRESKPENVTLWRL